MSRAVLHVRPAVNEPGGHRGKAFSSTHIMAGPNVVSDMAY
jgi:hypothetical protein